MKSFIVFFLFAFVLSSAQASHFAPPGYNLDDKDTRTLLYNIMYHNHVVYYSKNETQVQMVENMTCPHCNGPAASLTNVTIYQDELTNMCLVAYNKDLNAVIIAWRGTLSIINWLEDFDFPKVVWKRNGFQRVHEGFKNSVFGSIQPKVRVKLSELLKEHPSSKVYVTGHSLGGAQCSLSALDIEETFGNGTVSLVLGIASPLIGNKWFSKMYDSVLPNTIRLTNRYDPVPNGPSPVA